MASYYPPQVGVPYPQLPYYGQSYSGVPQSMGGAPIVMVPSGYYEDPYSFKARIRRFFGFAPSTGYRVRSDHNTWGFMGYSRRQRYIDARTGGEVDRQGRPVLRV